MAKPVEYALVVPLLLVVVVLELARYDPGQPTNIVV
jgi:hypothetical protein